MKILITTPTGRIGRRIVPELLAPEFAVRVITPNPDGLPTEIRHQIEIVRGDIDDPKALREALDGVDALFWCIPRPLLHQTNIRDYYERFARAASQAIRGAGTARVVAICEGPEAIATERLLNESGAAIRHLRCGRLMESSLQETDSIAQRNLMPIPITASADVADLALRLLVRTDWNGIETLAVPTYPSNASHQLQDRDSVTAGPGGSDSGCTQVFETLVT